MALYESGWYDRAQSNLYNEQDIKDLIAFHKTRFSGWTMTEPAPEPEPTTDPPPAEPTPEPKPTPDLGFPKDTPVAEMTAEQQAAYWKHRSRTHEDRNAAWQKVTGGKTADEIKAEREELERLRNEQRTESEKAIEEAKKQARASVVAEMAPKLAALAFDAALAHVESDRRKVLIDNLDLSKVITDDGDVDTDKVTQIAAQIAPADKGEGKGADFGAGRRGGVKSSGTASGADRYAQRHGKQSAS